LNQLHDFPFVATHVRLSVHGAPGDGGDGGVGGEGGLGVDGGVGDEGGCAVAAPQIQQASLAVNPPLTVFPIDSVHLLGLPLNQAQEFPFDATQL